MGSLTLKPEDSYTWPSPTAKRSAAC